MMRPEQHAEHTVLVVEDEPLLRELMAETLSDQGWDIVEAGSGDEALEALKKHPEIGLLFTDVTMPGKVDGCNLAREVHARRPDIAVVMTSGKMLPEDCDMPEGGIFVPKPYSQGAVADLIARMFG